ncbi:hypothetical protein G7Y79_00001g004090 [Physcia stellaris]|nr:hypothetical protein G7Y79_00001g004090 [Physcia stellaris]
MDDEEIRRLTESHHKRSIDEVADTASQQNKRSSIHSTATPFMLVSRPIATTRRGTNSGTQVNYAFHMEIEAWKEEYKVLEEAYKVVNNKLIAVEGNLAKSHNQNAIGNLAYHSVHRQLKDSQNAHDAQRTKAESSEREASQLSKQVEELKSALEVKETELNSFKEAPTTRGKDLVQQLHNSQTRLQNREQQVSALNDQLAACYTTIAVFGRGMASQKRNFAESLSTKNQELTEAGKKLSDTQGKLVDSEEQHRECRQILEQTVKLSPTELGKLNQSIEEMRQKVDVIFDRELPKTVDLQAAQESKVTTMESRMAEDVITKNKEIGQLKEEVAVWKHKHTQLSDTLSKEVAENLANALTSEIRRLIEFYVDGHHEDSANRS